MWHGVPVLVPPSTAGVPCKVGSVAFVHAKRYGLFVHGTPHAHHIARPSVSFGSMSCDTQSRSQPSSPAWSKPRAWSQPVGTPVRGGGSGSSSVRTGPSAMPTDDPSASPTKPRRWGSTRKRPTLEELYTTAHEVQEAPLTIPVGLINQGNSCFASVILQMLVYCRPLYCFLTQLRDIIPQDLSNSTPLLEAVFRFYTEVPLSSKLGPSLLQSSVDPILPDYIYDAMRLHKRFDLFQLGHQEDAEEFFSLVLSTLHEETQLVYRRLDQRQAHSRRRTTTPSAADPFAADPAPLDVDSSDDDDNDDVEATEVMRPSSPDQDEWLEVGQKGKTSLTRTSGTAEAPSPITRMFDGKLRSTLTTPGSKTSVMLEPYRSLPLDIEAPHIRSIADALRHITEPETISGVWSAGRHAFVDATKQVCIEALPPVLVLHLKRFVFDGLYGVQKSTKPISFGLTLDVAPEVLSSVCRRAATSTRYALFGVVFHHGRLASGGHYTVAVQRQNHDGWIHFDDTQAWPISSDDVLATGRGTTNEQGDAYLLFYQRLPSS
ncbi:ubiquitin-specific protease [Malassezia pachydermatis]|uniref:Ubiquitin carboxyl-terminal hydrolase n=1 Tax=Malassezia pachydermatis TaxID=77020 RepID=A0A0M8MUL4_9BASI|nr:ubiquitin-specific protease [Malassezia pachydermatis]KOS14644.1 ubiquitin-specific protease [Malassezia pachydermatis]